MKQITKVALFAALLAFPFYANAEEEMKGMDCPMMSEMHADMDNMMKEMHSMMEGMSDPSMKDRMQKMHDQMGQMMTHMHSMHGNNNPEENKSSETPSEDHSAHH